MWCTFHGFSFFVINGFHCNRDISSIRFHDLNGFPHREFISLCQSCQTSLIDLFRKAHERDINTNLDTSGQPFTREEPFFSKFNELLKYTDLVMLDIKHIDDEEHKKLTGHTNKNILDCARYLSEQGIPMWIRHVLVPGITDNDEYLKKTREFIDTLDTVMKVEVLPYHTLGAYKWKELGIPYKLEGVEPPTEERIQNAKKILEFNKYK